MSRNLHPARGQTGSRVLTNQSGRVENLSYESVDADMVGAVTGQRAGRVFLHAGWNPARRRRALYRRGARGRTPAGQGPLSPKRAAAHSAAMRVEPWVTGLIPNRDGSFLFAPRRSPPVLPVRQGETSGAQICSKGGNTDVRNLIKYF